MRQNSQEMILSSHEIPTMEVAPVPVPATTANGVAAAAATNEPSLTQDALETTVNTQLLPTEPVDESRLRRLFCFCCYCCCVCLEQTRRIPKMLESDSNNNSSHVFCSHLLPILLQRQNCCISQREAPERSVASTHTLNHTCSTTYLDRQQKLIC